MDKAFITPKVARPPTVVNRWICVYFYTGFPVAVCQLIATKILYFIASLICASLPITGFYIWWGKRKKRPRGTGQNG
ncbi:hypothetical protein [Parapedobacter sp. 2B3]|uniref:hypothetical protein n=1 Tax=Parapedobacter sp. 2B3 TaxID=3342381 RepID=UPI0035B5BA7E